jgi:hypothetical protein
MTDRAADPEAGRGYDASDPDQVKSRRERQKTRDLQKKAALSRLMSDPAGRMWVWDLLVRCGAFRLSFSTDALVMAFNEGRRDIGNHLISELHQIGPELYMRMSLENQPSGSASGGGA